MRFQDCPVHRSRRSAPLAAHGSGNLGHPLKAGEPIMQAVRRHQGTVATRHALDQHGVLSLKVFQADGIAGAKDHALVGHPREHYENNPRVGKGNQSGPKGSLRPGSAVVAT
jgi:hypothetical protein